MSDEWTEDDERLAWFQELVEVLSGVMKKSTPSGKLKPPYGGRETCTAEHCQKKLSEEDGAYLFKDLESEKLVVFCGICALHVELNCADRFALIPL